LSLAIGVSHLWRRINRHERESLARRVFRKVFFGGGGVQILGYIFQLEPYWFSKNRGRGFDPQKTLDKA